MLGIDSLIGSLPTFTGTPFFLGDEMHLIGRGLGTLVYCLLHPQKNQKFYDTIVGCKNYTFELITQDGKIFDSIDEKVNQSRVNIPSAFEGTWNSAVGISRAVDYIDFLLYVVPTIILPLVRSSQSRTALMNLVEGCSIALQWRISREDILKMKR